MTPFGRDEGSTSSGQRQRGLGASGEILSKNRVETFSDGIFAIVVTLLVLEIHVPQLRDATSTSELREALVELMPKFISLIVSFMTICVIWVNHHRVFSLLNSFDAGLFWLNANLILWVSLIPFPTALIGDLPSNAVALSFYGGILSLMALSFVFMRLYLQAKPHLLQPVSMVEFRKGTVASFLFGPIPYVIGALSAYIQPTLSLALYVLVPIYFIAPVVARSRA